MNRCGACSNCLKLEKVRKRVLACANPPFSHADDEVAELWNKELERLPCTGEMKVGETSRSKIQEAMENIMDTFTGADGGVAYTQLAWLVQSLDKDAAAGDKDAIEILSCVTKFNKLIEIAKRGGKRS